MSGFTVGPEWLQNSSLLDTSSNIVRNELLGFDDFANFQTHLGAGNYGRAAISGLTGSAELGLTLAALGLAPWTGGASVPTRVAGATLRQGAARVLRDPRLIRNVLKNPRSVVSAAGNSFRRLNPFTGRLKPIAVLGGRYAAGRYDPSGTSPEAELDKPAADAPPSDFMLNFGPGGSAGGGGRGGGGVPRGPSADWFENLMPMAQYETLLANQLDQIDARAGAYSTASDTLWAKVADTNRAAATKALELGAEFGEVGAQRWHQAAQNALDIAAARNEAIGMMSGGLPQGLGVSPVTEDFAQFAQATGDAERDLQEGLGQVRSEDLNWMAEQSGQAGAGYNAEFARARQDLTAAAVNSHNNRVIERNAMIAQMKFQSAMQQQALGAQAAMAGASRSQGADYADVYNLAGSLKDRVGLTDQAAAQMLVQFFPDVFGGVDNALAFYKQFGLNPPS